MQTLLARTKPPLAPPWTIWLSVMLVITITEFVIMCVLPWVIPQGNPHIAGAIIDSLLLTLILSPLLWWNIVWPLETAAQLREKFLSGLFSSIEDERRRIAHEIHDGVGQSLTLLISGLKSLPDTCDAAELQRRKDDLQLFAERALSDAKQLALGLRPSLLDDLGLVPALERIIAEIKQHHPLAINFTVKNMEANRLPEKMETALFRIVQESLNNIIKHANAQTVELRLIREPKCVTLEIQDDGCGIDPAELSRQSQLGGHLGMIGMQERAAQLNGTLLVKSTSGRGSHITVKIPWQAKMA